jgi:hypothetical protein
VRYAGQAVPAVAAARSAPRRSRPATLAGSLPGAGRCHSDRGGGGGGFRCLQSKPLIVKALHSLRHTEWFRLLIFHESFDSQNVR